MDSPLSTGDTIPTTPKRHVLNSIPTLKPTKIPKTKIIHSEQDDDSDSESELMSNNPKIQRYLLAIEYIGSRFSGSQKQAPNCRTVVGVIEDAFHKFIGQPVKVSISSRTDAGVHALSNVCHADVERISKRKPGEVLPAHEAAVVKSAVNHFLQKNEGDITVIDVRCVPSDFHARFRALERTYFYRLMSGPESLSTFENGRAWHVPEELDLVSMQKACRVLLGTHDFTSFRAAGCQAKSPIRTLDELNVTEVVSTPCFPSTAERGQSISLEHDSITSSESNGYIFGERRSHRCFVITARARSFLYHQVRLLVGVLKCVGTGFLTTNDVERILNAKTVTAASPMAPACGLYLAKVKYELP
ncbi:tRNA pseudouridine(38-40) synthase [Ranunculus cassubicifolius]